MPPGRARLAFLAVALLAASLVACRDALRSLGTAGGGTARAHGEEFFTALGVRVIDPWRDAKYDTARLRIASAAVLPNKVWRDTAIWTSITPTRRQILVRARFDGVRYTMQSAQNPPYPSAPGEARHVIALTRLSDDEYSWYTEVPYAIGTVKAAEVGAMFGAIFASAEGRTEAEVRADYRGVAPRTTRVMGQLFRMDSILTYQLADRSTAALFAMTMTPERIEERYPDLAKYLQRYVRTARMHLTLMDRVGNTYFDLNLSGGRITVRVRTAAGAFMSLYGPPLLMPDTLVLGADMTVRIRGFTVGVRNYRGDFRFVRTERERAWQIISRREPDWVLPLITERLLRTPLRRPFQGSGALVQIGVRDSAGMQTILDRRVRVEVQESAILRFLGRLGAIAISDYAGDVEAQEMAFLHEVFTALLDDIRGP